MTACTQNSVGARKNTIVVAVSRFNADDLECSGTGESHTPHLDSICDESIRFTHAYTPSTMSNASLASILTGLYPVEHGIRSNDAKRFKSEAKSLPERLSASDVSTYFISGGVPAFRKSGISQGFQVFDDYVRQDGGLYRPAAKVVERFLWAWENRGRHNSFFGVLFFADLQFHEIVSLDTALGLEAGESYKAKLREVDSAVGLLEAKLKGLKLWDSTMIIIVGLQGQVEQTQTPRGRDIGLFDEEIRIPLLIKPSRKPQDHTSGLKIDNSVTLVDLGKTLWDYYFSNDKPQSQFKTINLENVSSDEDRVIYSESSLLSWKNWGPNIVQARRGEWVLWNLPKPNLYNSFTDRLQLHNLYSKDYTNYSRLAPALDEYGGGGKGAPFVQALQEKIVGARTLFSIKTSVDEKLNLLRWLQLRLPDDWQLFQWEIRFLFEDSRWMEMRSVLKNRKPPKEYLNEYTSWLQYSELKLKLLKLEDIPQTCFGFLYRVKKSADLGKMLDQVPCEDSEVKNFIQGYIYDKLKKQEESDSLVRLAVSQSRKRIDQNALARFFWMNGAQWDFPSTYPQGPSVMEMIEKLEIDPMFLKFRTTAVEK